MMQGGVNHGTLLPHNTHKIFHTTPLTHPVMHADPTTPGGSIFPSSKNYKKNFFVHFTCPSSDTFTKYAIHFYFYKN
jgi:hypothetical protein